MRIKIQVRLNPKFTYYKIYESDSSRYSHWSWMNRLVFETSRFATRSLIYVTLCLETITIISLEASWVSAECFGWLIIVVKQESISVSYRKGHKQKFRNQSKPIGISLSKWNRDITVHTGKSWRNPGVEVSDTPDGDAFTSRHLSASSDDCSKIFRLLSLITFRSRYWHPDIQFGERNLNACNLKITRSSGLLTDPKVSLECLPSATKRWRFFLISG